MQRLILIELPAGESINSRVCSAVAEIVCLTAPAGVNTGTLPTFTTPPDHPETVPLIPFTPKLGEEIETTVNELVEDLRRTFEIYLRDDTQLPLWQPPLGLADRTRRHITDLKLPIIPSSSPLLLLLLHDLGQPSHDSHLAKRINELFLPYSR